MSFLSKLFGGKKEGASVDPAAVDSPMELISETLNELLHLADLDLTFDLSFEKASGENVEDRLFIEFQGPDEELVKDRDGQLLEALQLYVKRVIQNNSTNDQTHVIVDCGGFREASEAALVEMADRLKKSVIEKERAAFSKPLPARDRRVIHQHLANDERVGSKSIGEGTFKKVKIFPVRHASPAEE